MDIGFVVTGDRKVQLKFDNFPKYLHDGLLAKITSLTAELAARVRAAAPRKTGKLADSIVSQVFDNSDDRIRGRVTVDADFAKAAAIEYGTHGKASVSAHDMRLDHVFANRLAAPINVFVGAYSRSLDGPAFRFMRGPLDEMHAEIVAELGAVVQSVIEKDAA